MKLPSESPAKTSPPAVESAPPLGLLKYLNSHFSAPVIGSSALSAPLGLIAGIRHVDASQKIVAHAIRLGCGGEDVALIRGRNIQEPGVWTVGG